MADESELAAAAERVGFPAVLKPVESAGSVHVSRVDSLDGLRAAYRRLAADSRTDFGRGLDGPVLLEEYLDGPEISVEGYVEDGRAVVLAVTTKLLGTRALLRRARPGAAPHDGRAVRRRSTRTWTASARRSA